MTKEQVMALGLTDLQAKYKADTDALSEQIAKTRLNAAQDVAIMGAKRCNPKVIKALIYISKLKDDGTVDGLDLAALQKPDPYLLTVEKIDPKGPGYSSPTDGDPKAHPRTLQEAVSLAYPQNQAKHKQIMRFYLSANVDDAQSSGEFIQYSLQ